jgi:HD-GYP domain-containing protein (c-di-GMP phosphodiesterase class II)
VRHHHERFDGNGYLDGRKRTAIPLAARIVAGAETFDDMVPDQPYRRAGTVEAAAAEILRCSGTQFDPKVVVAFFDWILLPEDTRRQQ